MRAASEFGADPGRSTEVVITVNYVRCSELSAGEVVYFPAGPFVGLSGVVLDVDAELSMLRVEFAEGLDDPDGGVRQQRRRTVTVGFDELELAV